MPSNNRPYHFSGESIITTNRFADLLSNAMTSRAKLISKGMEMDDRRDIAKECGEPATAQVDTDTLRDLYERLGIAKRVVNILPDECWSSEPEIYESEDEEEETAFEEAWGELNSNLSGKSHFNGESGGSPVWQYLHKIDCLSGIGNYGLLLIGLNDGKELFEPVKASDNLQVVYLRAFDQTLCQITRFESDRSNPRYGLPLEYQITLNDPRQTGTGGIGLQIATTRVHWTRVIHVADNLLSSEVFGEPRMLPVLNNLLALRKLYSGSSEMFWRGAFPGYSLETHPQLGGDVEVDVDELRDMMESYSNSLQRYLTLSGMSAKPLAPQISDPTPQINAQIKAICITYGIPERIFMGSERGELASSQDQGAWNDRLRTRQSLYLLPAIIIPFTDRLISYGCLPVPEKGYNAHWPDVDSQSDLEKAQVAAHRTAALVQYVGGGGDAVVTPIDFLTRFLHFNQQEALEILEKAEEELAKEQEKAPAPVPGEMLPGEAPPEAQPEQQPPQEGAPQGGEPQNPFQPGSPTGNQGVDNSYFSECERDDKGHCLPRGDNEEEERTGSEHADEDPSSLTSKLFAGGGFSYQPVEDTSPTQGYMVSLDRSVGAERVIERGNLSQEEFVEQVENAIAEHIEEHWDKFETEPDLYIGGWEADDGKRVVLDLSERVPSKYEAVRRGKDRKQDGVFDLQTFETIEEKDYDRILEEEAETEPPQAENQAGAKAQQGGNPKARKDNGAGDSGQAGLNQNSYFSDCERDDKGHCLPRSGSEEEEGLSREAKHEARRRSFIDADKLSKELASQQTLTPEQEDALYKYSKTHNFDEANDYLRENGLTRNASALIKNVQSAASQPLPEKTVVFRGVSERIGNMLLSGKEYEAQGFVSASLDPEVARDFTSWAKGENTILEITAKTGVASGEVSSHQSETEVVQAHGTRYSVNGSEKVKSGRLRGIRVISLTEL